jgi:ATP-binding cassette subfamily B protein
MSQDVRSQKPLRRLMGYMLEQRLHFAAMVICMLAVAISMALLPVVIGAMTNTIAAGPGPLQPLIDEAINFTILVVILATFTFLGSWILAGMAQRALFRLRTSLFEKMQSLSLDFYDKQPIGELMSRVTNDTDIIEQFLTSGITTIIQNIMIVAITTVVMLVMNPWLTLVVYAVVLCLIIISYALQRIASPAFERLQQELASLNGMAEERLAGAKTVIAYNQQESSRNEFGEISDKAMKASAKAQFSALITMPLATVFSNIQIVAIAVVGSVMVINGDIGVAAIVAFLGFSSNLSGPLGQIFSMFPQLIGASTGAKRVFEILDQEPRVADKANAPELPAVTGDVVFDHVDFSYVKGRKVLKDNHFHANPGNVIGLCGPTGAGKSTIINILTRYYDIDSGSIRVDGKRIDEVQQNTLRIQIAQVLQEPFLFSDTIMNNLRYARANATDEECIAAAKQANAHDFVMAMPDGYNTFLVDGGGNLSLGQRQMLTIARAIVADPRMLILDEATSNVDTQTEKKIQAGLLKLQEGKTSFIIAHRLSTIRHADMIMVINKGEIIERGSHKELIEAKGFYYNLYMTQFRGKSADGGQC